MLAQAHFHSLKFMAIKLDKDTSILLVIKFDHYPVHAACRVLLSM